MIYWNGSAFDFNVWIPLGIIIDMPAAWNNLKVKYFLGCLIGVEGVDQKKNSIVIVLSY